VEFDAKIEFDRVKGVYGHPEVKGTNIFKLELLKLQLFKILRFVLSPETEITCAVVPSWVK
jgi:hypothetical protein